MSWPVGLFKCKQTWGVLGFTPVLTIDLLTHSY
uniref:Uncharacterized protein n=1 Tax=Anguilla anguilla TaxID=7936 RepID=A0A0E9R9G3_ANGAN